MGVTQIAISREVLQRSAGLAGECSSASVRERVLVSQAVALAFRQYLQERFDSGQVIEDGRSSSLKYVELLDICDFRIGGWQIDVRSITVAERDALYVPTMPLMVGVLSDFYVGAQVDSSITGAEILGYANRTDLAEAELTGNGLFAVVPNELLKPLSDLVDIVKKDRIMDSEDLRHFQQWQARADRIVEGAYDLLSSEKELTQEEVERLASVLRDSVLAIYGGRLPETGLEPLFDKLFQRFGLMDPVPGAPQSEVAFINRTEDVVAIETKRLPEHFFHDGLNVRQRVSLYRYLLEKEDRFEEHRKLKKVLDQATGGKHQASPRRQARLRTADESRAKSLWLEPPTQPRHSRQKDGLMELSLGIDLQKKEERQFKLGQRVLMPGHFAQHVVLEEVRSIGAGYECRVRLADGSLDETIISEEEAVSIFQGEAAEAQMLPVNAEHLRLLVESTRIRLAYAHDDFFAVSLSGIQTLPHQIEAVYMKMLPQPRLRFLLADDPGAGKTIMAGLLIKEMKLRQAIERVLILSPAPLTLQWQDELLKWFGEEFEIISSATDQRQLLNQWQRNSQVIASMDYAKQENVRERVWQQEWDLVIIDEAHKCSAYTKHSSQRSPEAGKTKRYQLAEKLSEKCDHLLLLTATPHHGNEDRFNHFLRLLDPDLFPEPHKLPEIAGEINRNILKLGHDCPWALRRLKEDLRDLDGHRLFPDRIATTVRFKLNSDEYTLYKSVASYINEYLPGGAGRQKASVALVRTVLQRRLASSTEAIYESMKRRLNRQRGLLEELEALTPSQQARRLAQIQGVLVDSEQDEDDLDDAQRDALADEYTAAVELRHLQSEVAALRDLVEQARIVRDTASDSKLTALRDCLKKAEFNELKEGSARLLIFTEHRDTLNYLHRELEKWGFSVCEIHGGMNVHERKRAQEVFRTTVQICVATEAAGEGINLQFCHLMINYDLPWNPTRLEQRLGRIHRIGQKRTCYCYNFVATESEDGQPVIEGRILERLLEKMEQIKGALEGRVYDVIGEILSINEVNLPAMIQEATLNPGRLDEKLDDLERIDPEKWRKYEEATGIALARDKFDVDRFKQFQEDNFEAEERRLMPRYVEEQFKATAKLLNLRLDERADGLFRLEHVPQDLRSERWESVRRMGKPDTTYRKLTFNKDVLEKDQHIDAVLLGPGHSLYAVADEALNFRLASLSGQVAFYVDPLSPSPYRIHFFEMSIRGQDSQGNQTVLYGELVAVREEGGKYEVVPSDSFINLALHATPPQSVNTVDVQGATDFLKSSYQLQKSAEEQQERQHFVTVCREYLETSFKERIKAAQNRVMALRARERDDEAVARARANAEADLEKLKRDREDRFERLERLAVARTGPVRHVATAIVLTPADSVETQMQQLSSEMMTDARRASELAAEDHVIAHEESLGWKCQRVGNQKIGFDIRSIGPSDPATGQRNVRRIEVKGRYRGEPIRLTPNEWLKASQLGSTYWLYVVWDPTTPQRELLKIKDPARVLDHAKREIAVARMVEFGGAALTESAKQCEETR